MSTATQGRAREYRVRDNMIAAGWYYVMRAAGSKGAGDLLMGHWGRGAALVQVGTDNKKLGPKERERFVFAAQIIGAIPLLATANRAGIRYWYVTRDTPSTWQEFKP